MTAIDSTATCRRRSASAPGSCRRRSHAGRSPPARRERPAGRTRSSARTAHREHCRGEGRRGQAWGLCRPIGVRAQALLRQEVEINIDHGTSNPDSTLPPARGCAGPLQGRPAAINAFAGERRRVICVKIRPNSNKRKRRGADDGTVPNCRWHRCRRAAWRRGSCLCDRVAPGDCGGRASRAAGLRCRPRQARPRPGGDRQLQQLPYRARRQELCRRSAGADPVRHDLLLEHHAGCGDRNRAMVGSRVSARDALRRQPRRPAPLSDIPIRPLHQCQRRG